MAASAAITTAMMSSTARPVPSVIARLKGLRRRDGRPGICSALIRSITFNYLVELATVEPDATTSRTIIDLDALAFAHSKIDLTGRAEESRALCSDRIIHRRFSFHFIG